MKRYTLVFIMTLLVLFASISSAVTPTYNLNEYYPYGKEAYHLSRKISKLKDKYKLRYRDQMDLAETCKIVCDYSRYSKFDKYEVSSVVLAESRFNQYAYNKKSGAKGLGQLYRVRQDYKFCWLTNEYDKHQNIMATVLILQDKLKTHKSKHISYARYNGRLCNETLEYARFVEKVKRDIKKG